MKLPGELCNQIYGLIFFCARPDTVILINNLERRKTMRGFRSKSYKLDRTTKVLAKLYNMLNETPASITRLSVPIVGLLPIFETRIWNMCWQNYQEALHTFHGQYTFAYYLPLTAKPKSPSHLCPSINLSHVRNFRLELHLSSVYALEYDSFWPETEKCLSVFQSMSSLRHLQLVITSYDIRQTRDDAASFNNSWHMVLSRPGYSRSMRTIVKTIPKDVKVICGLAQEFLDIVDYGGFDPIDNAAIQRLYDMHKDEHASLAKCSWVHFQQSELLRDSDSVMLASCFGGASVFISLENSLCVVLKTVPSY
jgi:hypothetical protein